MKLKLTMKPYRIWIPILIGVFVVAIPFFPSIRIDKSFLNDTETEIIDVRVDHNIAKPQQFTFGMPTLVRFYETFDFTIDVALELPVLHQVQSFSQLFRHIVVVRAP